MSEKRNLATPISIAVAIVSAAWALYATQHKSDSGSAAPPQAAGARASAPAFVSVAPVRSERVSQKLEALGNARANESVDVSSKTSNIVTAVMFRDGERVKRGQLLVQLDDAQTRADVAAAEAALAESERLYNRSREHLGTTDAMVILARRKLIKAAKAFRDQGVVPPGVDKPELFRMRSGGAVLPKGMDGLEVLRELKAEDALKTIPVVMLTSSREEQDLVRSYQLGVNAYVVKPVDFRAFIDAVRQLGAFWGVINEPPPGGSAPSS